MSDPVQVISGGAAQALVTRLTGRFAAEAGRGIEGSFGAVGAMRERLLGGAPCDVLILTQALIDQLVAEGHAVPGSAQPLGVVKTGVAVKAGDAVPAVDSPEALKAALRAARGLFLPDPVKATAGIHVMKVLRELGLEAELAGRLHPYPNGLAAMRAMAQAEGTGWLGCTQVTEILFAGGVALAGRLPGAFELSTVYTAAVAARSEQPQAAGLLVGLLAGADAAALRAEAGFE